MRGGANAMPSLQQRSELSILLGQFSGLPVALLDGAALVSVAIGGFLEAGAIMAVVALNGGIGFATERRGGPPPAPPGGAPGPPPRPVWRRPPLWPTGAEGGPRRRHLLPRVTGVAAYRALLPP